jgi:hypothetical protein
VTLDQSEPSASEIAEDGPEGEWVLNLLRSIPPVPEEIASNALVLKDVEPKCLPGRLSLSRLGKLLRRRKRT